MAITVWPADAVTGAPSYTGRKLRQTNAPALAGATSARPLGARSGVRPGTPTTTVAATSTTWTVTPHAGVIDGEASAIAGPYWYAVDANVTGSVTAAHATLPRKDLVYVQLSDPAEGDGSGAPGVAVLYTAGTAAASPSAPATPARSIALAEIAVPQSGGGSPTVSFVAPYVTGPGGVIPVRNTTERNLLTSVASSENPMVVHRKDANAAATLEVCHDGVNWRPVSPVYVVRDSTGATKPEVSPTVIQSFVVQDVTTAGGLITVPFPQAFTVAPIVQVTTVSGSATAAVVNGNAITTTGVTFILPGAVSANVRLHVTATAW